MTSQTAIAPHLRKYVVEQDYPAYTARDQAVWRFAVRHGHARLREIAHPAYATGFAAAGISTESIPTLRDMHARLSEVGFGVVCVDGFIPPRVFQAFQARGILPVAADVRTAAHLTYTPAPDIIHEAAGHAPFLPHPAYARFLRRIGAVSEQAFENSHDRALYEAIYALSELKERPHSSLAEVTAAESALLALQLAPAVPSEAARMARLYWWTVEYGLVGTLRDYRLYGAGLLSSVGEAHSCFNPRVQKLPLSADCVNQDYDITRAQPRLFVARDFGHLDEVLCQVESTLSHVRGGEASLAEAKASGDLAHVTLDSGFGVVGVVDSFDDASVTLTGPCAFTERGMLWPSVFPRPERTLLALGTLQDGTPLSALTCAQVRQSVAHGRLLWLTRAGLRIEGKLEAIHERAGRAAWLLLRELRVARGGALLFQMSGSHPLLLAERVITSTPVIPDGYHAATPFPEGVVPRPCQRDAAELQRIDMHRRLAGLRTEPTIAVSHRELISLHQVLRDNHPNEWLLRVNLLEVLARSEPRSAALVRLVEQELERLEQHFKGREPIAMALRELRKARDGSAVTE
jgi:phenylalanine-4-hydroxylase